MAQGRYNFLPGPVSMRRKEEPLAEKVEGEALTLRVTGCKHSRCSRTLIEKGKDMVYFAKERF